MSKAEQQSPASGDLKVAATVSSRPASRRPGDAAGVSQLEEKEGALWRLTLLVVLLLATATSVAFWESLSALGERLPGGRAIAGGIGLLMLLFVAYVWKKKREISELRGFIRGLQTRNEAMPTEQQLERLLDVVGRSQQGYRDLIDSFDDPVFTFSLTGEVLAANRSLATILEKPFSQIIGGRLDDFIEEPSRATVEKALPRFLEKRHWQGVARVRLRSGAVRYVDFVLQAIVKEGAVTGVSCLARDVTQQRESEQRFKELFETLQEGVYFTTPEGKLLDANPTLVRMLGYESQEELLAKRAEDLYVEPADRAALMEEMNRDGTVRNREILLRKNDGSTLICLDTSSAIRDSAGKVVRYQGALVDVTEQRQMEKRLHEEQEFARRLVDSFPDLIVVLDREGRYTFVSPNITSLLGFKPEELIGRMVGERSQPDDQAAIRELAQGVMSGCQPLGTLEYRMQHKDGSWRVFRAAATPLYGPTPPATPENPNPRPEIRGLIASSRDFTDFKRLEQQVIQSEKLAAMGQMIAGVAHELNNPLTAIVGMSDLLRDQAGDAASRRQLDLVNQQARRAADIVGNLLSFSRPTVAQKSLANLSDLVAHTLQLHEYALRVNNIKIDFQKEPALPPVLADANQLMQVFLNLIVNAEHAIKQRASDPAGECAGTLRVRLGATAATATDPSSVWVTFQDDGPGIPADVLPKIFDPFFTTKRPGRGTGLGLSICMAIIREHGGTIEAHSSERGGARGEAGSKPVPAMAASSSGRGERRTNEAAGALFRIVLPRAETQATEREKPVASNSGADASNPLRGRRVLVVDDEASIRELVEAGLSARGLAVHCAESGEVALARVEQAVAAGTPYDLVLCDVKMPGLSGDQMFEQMREKLARNRGRREAGSLGALSTSQANGREAAPMPLFVFMTGDLVEADPKARSDELGTRFVQKPFRISDLLPVLTEALLK
ncbi:MAG: PAS domain S-box protein [Candidatus Acidiferrales bacterium]